MLSSHDLMERTGITYRELDNWIRQGVLPVATTGHHGRSFSSLHIPGTVKGGSGYSRYFSERTARIAAALKLLRPHFGLPALKAAYAGLDALAEPWPALLWITPAGTVSKRRPGSAPTAVCLNLAAADQPLAEAS